MGTNTTTFPCFGSLSLVDRSARLELSLGKPLRISTLVDEASCSHTSRIRCNLAKIFLILWSGSFLSGFQSSKKSNISTSLSEQARSLHLLSRAFTTVCTAVSTDTYFFTVCTRQKRHVNFFNIRRWQKITRKFALTKKVNWHLTYDSKCLGQ